MIAAGRLIDLRSPLRQPRALVSKRRQCKSRAESIRKYETCMAGTKHAKNTDTSGGAAQGGWSNSLQGGGANRPTGWSESLQWVERIAPAPHRRHRPPERGSGQEKAFSSVKIGFSVSPPIFSLARCRLAHRLHSLPAATADRLVGLSCLRSGRPRSFARGSRAWVGKSTRHPHFHP